MIDFYQVGQKISSLRLINHLSQEELANKLFVTRQTVSKWENGTSIPSIDTILELAKLYNVSFEDILCLNENIDIDIDENDIFKNHNRLFVLDSILTKKIVVNIPFVFNQFIPNERIQILKAIKENRLTCDLYQLCEQLTVSEIKYLGGNVKYEIEESHN